MFDLNYAQGIAEGLVAQLAPHCDRISIAGSIRRQRDYVKDIEIVAIPKPYDVGLFSSGIATVVNQWESVRGKLPCKYTQRKIPIDHRKEVINLDLFFAVPENWGYILVLRTGSADFCKKLGKRWVEIGIKSVDGFLTKYGERLNTFEEEEFFNRLRLPYVKPKLRI